MSRKWRDFSLIKGFENGILSRRRTERLALTYPFVPSDGWSIWDSPLLTAMPPRSCWLERQPLSCEIAPSEGQVARSLAASTLTAVICRYSRSSSISKEAAHARSAKVLLNSYEDFAVLQAQNAAAAAARLPSAPTHVPIAFQSTYKQPISLSIAISVRWSTNSKSPAGRTIQGLIRGRNRQID